MTDAVSRLFKLSKLLGKYTTRDRHAKAEVARDAKLDDFYDIAHVKNKFEDATAEPWLLERLGRAITKRRQFIRYCHHHREKLADKLAHVPKRQENAADDQRADIVQSVHPSVPRTSAATAVSKPSMVLTTASTLGPVNVDAVDDGFDDAKSFSTMATSLHEDSDKYCLSVPRLGEFTTPGVPFECPYCLTIQTFNGQRGWK